MHQVPAPALAPSRNAVRCQRAIVVAGRKLLAKQIVVARRCVDTLLTCRLAAGTAGACGAVADRCGRKLAELADPAGGARARLTATIVKTCASVPPDGLVLPSGLGFVNAAAACAALGAPPPTGADTIAPCVGAAYACASGSLVRRALPLVDAELARVGLALGDDFACPILTASPTPTLTPGGPTPTRTATATPTVVPTAAPVTLLVPGGGGTGPDCVSEWTVTSRAIMPPPVTTVDCVDGDPSCDLDGVANDICRFRVGLCLTGTDPLLPDCAAAPGLVSFKLQSPQPAASNPIDAANAAALMATLADLLDAVPGGTGNNVFAFSPPHVLTPPAHCTAPVTLQVERRGLTRRTELFRTRAIGAASAGGTVRDDRDTLVLGCVAPGS
jgi:hypothetical protein